MSVKYTVHARKLDYFFSSPWDCIYAGDSLVKALLASRKAKKISHCVKIEYRTKWVDYP